MITKDLKDKLNYQSAMMVFFEPSAEAMCGLVDELMNQKYYDDNLINLWELWISHM